MVIGLVLYNGSVLAEVVRAGILAVPKGQTEAALAIGLRKTQIMSIVLLPQALTSMLPAVVSQLVVIVKDTALGGILVGYVELRRAANTSASNYGNLLPTYVVVAVIYILINLRAGLPVDLPGAQAAHPPRRRAGRRASTRPRRPTCCARARRSRSWTCPGSTTRRRRSRGAGRPAPRRGPDAAGASRAAADRVTALWQAIGPRRRAVRHAWRGVDPRRSRC